MYTECTIQWVDDKSCLDVIIKSGYEFDPEDDKIFFYGLDRQQLINAQKSNEIMEGEWRVVSVGCTYDEM